MLLRSVPVAAYPLPSTLAIPSHGTRLRDFSYRLPSCAASQCPPLRLQRPLGEGLIPEAQFCGNPWPTGSRVDSSQLGSAVSNFGSLAASTRLSLLAAPQAQTADHRLAEIAFAPDAAFDYPPVRLQGSLSPAPPENPRQSSGLVEESFHAGLERWIGDTAGWQLDAAGARPAGLALLQPSLELDDYDFEFFARIEARGLTFVFRASNFSNYQKVALGLTESGGYELRRTAVIGGVEEPGSAVSLGTPARSGSAFTIKTRARRNDFTIWFDGESVAHWSDGRLPAGGIGFNAARNTRARIYWVKLAPLGGPHTEAASRRPLRSIP